MNYEVLQKNLDRMAHQIDIIINDLNDSESRCECCDMLRADNWHEAQAKKELRATANKLRKWGKRLVAGSEIDS